MNIVRLPTLTIPVVMMLVLMSPQAATAEPGDDAVSAAYDRFRTALAQVERGDRRGQAEARLVLTRLRGSSDPLAPTWLALAMVRWSLRELDSEAGAEKAREQLAAITTGIDDEGSLPLELRLEVARCQAAAGDVAGALARFDAIGSAIGGLAQVRAAAGAAEVFRGQRRYDEALRYQNRVGVVFRPSADCFGSR